MPCMLGCCAPRGQLQRSPGQHAPGQAHLAEEAVDGLPVAPHQRICLPGNRVGQQAAQHAQEPHRLHAWHIVWRVRGPGS